MCARVHGLQHLLSKELLAKQTLHLRGGRTLLHPLRREVGTSERKTIGKHDMLRNLHQPVRSLHELRLRLAWHQTWLLNGNETSGRLNVRLLCCSMRMTTKHALLRRKKLLMLLLLLVCKRVRQLLLLTSEVWVESDQRSS